MKKRLLSFVTVIILLFSVCMTAFAEGEVNRVPVRNGGTAAGLKSYGAIVYQKGSDTIIIDSGDLYKLADQIDQVKLDVIEQLEVMNTYFTVGEGITLTTSEDVNVVHAEPYEEDFVDPLDVNFDTLLEGIAVSQSISQEPSEYGYEAGTILYRTKDGMLTDTFEDESQEITVASATADNLSAGTAAWVDGQLILGTGADNQNYYEKGHGQTSETIVNIISLLYSGINETIPYTVSGKDGSSVSVSVKSKDTTESKGIAIRSELIPVWDLDGEEKRLLTKLKLDVDIDTDGARSDDHNATSGHASVSYVVYDENGQAIGSGSGDKYHECVIDAMALPITTQNIYVEAAGSVYVHKSGHGSGTGSAHITFKGVQATYLINEE